MIGSRVRRAMLFAFVLTLVAGGIAFAAKHGASHKPTTSQQTATFSVTGKRLKSRQCKGTDGSYVQSRDVYTGTMSGGSDARLNGPIRIAVHSLINTTTGDGTTRGSIWWLKSTGKGKSRVVGAGSLVGVDSATGTPSSVQSATLHGFILAHLAGVAANKKTKTAAVPAGTLYANFKAMPGGSANSWTGQLGGSSLDSRTPAVLQSGHC